MVIKFNYRITKYNPEYRNSLGAYQKDEWTSISDVGKRFEGTELIFPQYLKIEDAYIKAIMMFMESLNMNFLCVTSLEKHQRRAEDLKYCSSSMRKIFNTIALGQQVTQEEVADIARLVLREDLWCKLENERMFIHFGYDYCMYIGSSKIISDKMLKEIEKNGLFVETFDSPYLENPEDVDDHNFA